MPDIGVPSTTTPVLQTYLDLTRRLAQETGVTKDPVTSIPTLVSAIGETKRLMDWICSAWRDIQNIHTDWRFLRRSTTFVTVDGQATYTPLQAGVTLGTFGQWDLKSFRVYNTAAGINNEIDLTEMDYDAWRNFYQFSSMRSSKSQPTRITETPDSSLGLGQVPLAGYTVYGDYYLAPVDLIADADIPTLPSKHDKMIIIYKAMEDHGYFEAASEVLGRGKSRYKAMLNRLEMDQLKRVYGGGALA
jgi:hypothetical protein